MPAPAAVPSRSARAARWLAPGGVAGVVGGLAAGLVEGWAARGVTATAVTAGFVTLLVAPVLVGLALLGRGLVLAWQPRVRFAGWRERGGGMPNLAGWIAAAALCSILLAVMVVRGTWEADARIGFTPRTMQLVYPLLTVGAAVIVIALSRPLALGSAAVARRLDAAWQQRGHSTLLAPSRLLLASAAGVGLALLGTWRWVLAPRLGPFDASPLHAPLVGIAVAIAILAAWRWLGRARLPLGVAAAFVAGAATVTALITSAIQPATTLEVWGEQPIAGLAIESLYDLESIRTGVALARYRPRARPGVEHPDVVLVTIDTVRADHTPPYGGRAAMPVLAELAARGSVFEWAFAPSNVTRRSIPAMVTGLFADRVRGRVVGWALRLDPRHVLLAERLTAGGYDTAGFLCCEGIWGPKARTGLQRGLAHLELERDGHVLAQRAADWIGARDASGTKTPFFLWIHIIEPHNWTDLRGEPSADRQRRYDRALEHCDAMLGTLLAPFGKRDPTRRPVVVVTADHGEGLGEHGNPYHSTDLYNSQLRVPLVIAGPGVAPSRITETVSLVGLTPTVLELAGFEVGDARLDGVSMAALATGTRRSTDDGRAFAAMIKDRSNPGNVTAYVKGRWKLLRIGDRTELYDIHADPGELTDLAVTQPTIRAELERDLAMRNAAALVSPFE